MKVVSLIFTFLISSNIYACGDYLIKAMVIMKGAYISLVINPDTQSEINLAVDFKESTKLSPYIGRIIETRATMEIAMDGTRGSLQTVSPIEAFAPDPLSRNKGTSMKLVKKIDCKIMTKKIKPKS